MSILMPPGTYTVKLSAGGQELRQPLIVKKDPNSGGTEADIAAQTAMMIELRQDLETGSKMANQIEFIRAQLLQLSPTLNVSSDSGVVLPRTATLSVVCVCPGANVTLAKFVW